MALAPHPVPGMGADAAERLTAPTPHVAELQSIRGIAALVVVIGHCISYYSTPEWWGFVKHLVNTQVSVEIFFVLSGFVLTLSLSGKPLDRPTMVTYYVKRLFRIYPALIAASVLAFGYVWFWHYQQPIDGVSAWIGERFRQDRFTPLHVAASFAGMLAFLIPPVWTIFVEIVASALLPISTLLFVRDRRSFWWLVIALLLISAVLGGALYYRVDMYLFDFAIGAALLAMKPAWLRPLTRHVPLGVLVSIAAVLLIATRAFADVDVWDRWMHLYEVALAAFIIFAFGRCGLVSEALRHRAMVWLGDISYSVYLFHFAVMCVVAKLLFTFAPDLHATIGGITLGWILCAITILLTLPLCHLTYHLIERPGIAAGGIAIRRLVRGQLRGTVKA